MASAAPTSAGRITAGVGAASAKKCRGKRHEQDHGVRGEQRGAEGRDGRAAHAPGPIASSARIR